ncbi:SiaB family protein kinase [Candidatus Halobeggiatoa sp. HSG11]|nr:SiaB family protein kinase [Candidatus Halobeggiatoa sp. HSG11]
MLSNLHELKIMLNQQGLFFCFGGPISQELMVGIGDTLRNKMKFDDADSKTIVKVFSMFVEQSQNIIHYSAEKTPPGSEKAELSNGIIGVGYDNDYYYVSCGNMIHNEAVDSICEQLTRLQVMDRDELKRYYKERRRKDSHKDSKGAGLGFIELARKSVKPIEFNVQKVDENFSFFSLKTTI